MVENYYSQAINNKYSRLLFILLTIATSISIVSCGKSNVDTGLHSTSSNTNEPPKTNATNIPSKVQKKKLIPIAKLITYKEKFRRNSPSYVEHLSLVFYFPKSTKRRSPYKVIFDIQDNQGNPYSQIIKYVGANPCKRGYTGQQEILECPLPAFKEIVLKSQQEVEPAITKGLIKNGRWWITKGFQYPSFSSSQYSIISIKIYDQESDNILWEI